MYTCFRTLRRSASDLTTGGFGPPIYKADIYKVLVAASHLGILVLLSQSYLGNGPVNDTKAIEAVDERGSGVCQQEVSS